MHLGLLVWRVDTKSEHLQQEARARDISLSGALVSGIDADVRSGNVIGILYAGRKARYRVYGFATMNAATRCRLLSTASIQTSARGSTYWHRPRFPQPRRRSALRRHEGRIQAEFLETELLIANC
jgi:hypothetical protein